jgi:UDP-N-acetyl-D-mannosaminuronic acid dehydrogenase
VEITENVARLGCQVLAVEPNMDGLPLCLKRPNVISKSLEEALSSADVFCVLVKNSCFLNARKLISGHGATIDAVGLLADFL